MRRPAAAVCVAAVAGHDGVDEIATPLDGRFRASNAEHRAERGQYDGYDPMHFRFGLSVKTCAPGFHHNPLPVAAEHQDLAEST
jgi:hypothetical protein